MNNKCKTMKRNELRFGKSYLGEYLVSLWAVKQKPDKDRMISGSFGKTKFKAFVNLIRWLKKYNNLKELFYVRSIKMENI